MGPNRRCFVLLLSLRLAGLVLVDGVLDGGQRAVGNVVKDPLAEYAERDVDDFYFKEEDLSSVYGTVHTVSEPDDAPFVDFKYRSDRAEVESADLLRQEGTGAESMPHGQEAADDEEGTKSKAVSPDQLPPPPPPAVQDAERAPEEAKATETEDEVRGEEYRDEEQKFFLGEPTDDFVLDQYKWMLESNNLQSILSNPGYVMLTSLWVFVVTLVTIGSAAFIMLTVDCLLISRLREGLGGLENDDDDAAAAAADADVTNLPSSNNDDVLSIPVILDPKTNDGNENLQLQDDGKAAAAEVAVGDGDSDNEQVLDKVSKDLGADKCGATVAC